MFLGQKNRRTNIFLRQKIIIVEIEKLIKTIIQCAYNVRKQLTAGFLENVYQKAMIIELKENGIQVTSETPINV